MENSPPMSFTSSWKWLLFSSPSFSISSHSMTLIWASSFCFLRSSSSSTAGGWWRRHNGVDWDDRQWNLATSTTYGEKDCLNFATQLATSFPNSIEQLVCRDPGAGYSFCASQHPYDHIRDWLLWLQKMRINNLVTESYCTLVFMFTNNMKLHDSKHKKTCVLKLMVKAETRDKQQKARGRERVEAIGIMRKSKDFTSMARFLRQLR